MNPANVIIVAEHHIERASEMLGADEHAYEAALSRFNQEQPQLLAYFFSEDFEAFSQGEREFMLYLALVIWQACTLAAGPPPVAGLERLAEAEERNWELLQGVNARLFRERLDVFFADSPQEDLLAFIEDALSEEDVDNVTLEGREAMFVSLKTVVDVLAKPRQ
jgi:hypothetical protein